jgi:hypothetical protein
MRETPQEKEGKHRHLEAIKGLEDDTLLLAYAFGRTTYPNVDVADVLVKAVIDTRLATRIVEGTKQITSTTEQLVKSSDRLETLTDKLKSLTWVLIIFAVVQIVIAGVQTWKMFQPEKPIQVVVQPPQSPAPQTPTLPAH